MQHAKSVEDRFACLEHVVQARVGALEYLHAFHTLQPSAAGPNPNPAAAAASAVWLDTVGITRADMDRHFADDGETTGRGLTPVSTGDRASPVPGSPSIVPGISSGGGGGLRVLDNARKNVHAADSWLDKHVGRWFDLGYALARLLVLPALASGPAFVGAINELLLELDHAAAEGHSAKRALAQRALRHDREDRGVALQRPPVGSGYVFHVAPPRRFGRPAYVRTVASMLSTLVLVYRKLLDTDIASDAGAYRRFCRFDAFVDSHVLGVITKEMDHVGRWKVALEADSVMELVLVAAAPATAAATPSSVHADPAAAATDEQEGARKGATTSSSGGKKSGWRSWFGKSPSSAASTQPAAAGGGGATPPPLSPAHSATVVGHVRTSSIASSIPNDGGAHADGSGLPTPMASSIGRYAADAAP